MARLNGKDKVLLVQPTDNLLKADGYLVGDETEHSHSMERELLDEQTKYGRILGPGQLSESFDITFYADNTDLGQKAFVDSIREGTQLKIWDVEKTLTNGKHNAIFAYVYVESLETSSPTDGFVEISATVQVINHSKRGQLEKLPDSVLNFGDYEFEAPGETTGEFNNENGSSSEVTGVALVPSTLKLKVDAEHQLIYAVIPAGAKDKTVTFSSGTEANATVSATGLVKGVKAGASTITVTTTDGSFTDTCEVTVST